MYYANLIASYYTSRGTRGTPNDPNCYAEAESALRRQSPLAPFKESIAADLAAWQHSHWMSATKTFSHTGAGGSNPMTRLQAVGTWASSWDWTENIAYSGAPVTVDTFMLLWLADCSIYNCAHRSNIFATYVQYIGCCESGMYVTCDGAQKLTLKPAITAAILKQAGLTKAANDAGYTGV